MASELYIEDKLINLSDADFEFNIAVSKIGELDSRAGYRSTSIEINDIASFNYLMDLNNQSDLMYKKLKARYYSNGIDLMIRFASIEEVGKKYVKLRLYGGNSDVYDLMKSKQLRDVSFDELDHFWNITNIVGYRANTTGVTYPIIDRSIDSPNTIMSNANREVICKYTYPAVYVSDILRLILEDLGVDYENPISQKDFYPSLLCVPFSSKQFLRNRKTERYEGVFEKTANQAIGVLTAIKFEQVNNPTKYFTVASNTNRDGAFIFANTLNGRFKASLQVQNTGAAAVVNFLITTSNSSNGISQIIPNGTTTIDLDYTLDADFDGTATPFVSLVCSTSSVTMSILSGSTFEISETEALNDNVSDIAFDVTIENTLEFVSASSIMPDMTVAEFILNYCKTFGLFLYFDELKNKVVFFNLSTVTDNIGKCYDWSSKYAMGDEVLTTSNDLAQRNTFIYEVADGEIKPVGADGSININNKSLVAENEMVALDFVATSSFKRLIDIDVLRANLFDKDGTEYIGEDNPRFVINKLYNSADFVDTSDFVYRDGLVTSNQTTNIPIPYFIKSGETSLGFNNNLISLFYNEIEVVYTKIKILSCLLRLNASDINQLDLTKPVYIEYFNSYFYISQISSYNPNSNKSTSVELVKLY